MQALAIVHLLDECADRSLRGGEIAVSAAVDLLGLSG